MKRVLSIVLAFSFLIGLLVSCGDAVTQKTTPTPTASPAPTASSTTPDPAVSGTWYAYAQNQYGLALMRMALSLDADSFEEQDQYWDGDSWEIFSGVRGSLAHISGSSYTATLQGIYFEGSGWGDSSTPGFDEYRRYVWTPGSNAARATFAVSSGELSYRRDQDGDEVANGAGDYEAVLGTSSTTALLGSGTYPYLVYVGFNFHRSSTQAHCYLQIMSMAGAPVDDTGFASVTIKVTDAAGAESGNIALSWFSARQEWGVSPYAFADPAGGGLWWVSEIAITGRTGYGSAVYDRSNPYDAWSVAYTTDTAFSSTATAVAEPGQCHMPPNAAPAGSTMYYIETVANASSGADTDIELFLYEEGDTDHWIAFNDDGDSDSFADMQIALQDGHTYLLKVVDMNGTAGTYSLRVSTSGFLDTNSTATIAMGEDAYEDDDISDTAKPIPPGTLQDRCLTAGDVDWAAIEVVMP
jgi:hypothetical protein